MQRITIEAPKTICIYDPSTTRNTYEFFNRVMKVSAMGRIPVTLDLSNVTTITAAASVLLFAVVNTCQLHSGNQNAVRCNFPRSKDNEEGHKFIVRTGLGRALHSGTLERIKDLTESSIYFQSATSMEDILLPTLELLSRETKLDSEQLDLLIAGVVEAMLNVGHHAYKDPSYPPESKVLHPSKVGFVDKVGERWWQCAWYDTSSHAWIFIICDLGLGIPLTYNCLIKNKLYDEAPSSAVKDAFLLGNSRFVGHGRGNGSDDMKRPVECGAQESLYVFSGKVKYEYHTGMVEPKVVEFDSGFNGTLVQWTLYANQERVSI